MLVPVILCGGSGSRLWPVSRDLHPKPFIRLANGQSFLQNAWLRGASLPQVSEVLTVTNRDLLFKTESEYQEVTGDLQIVNSYILEPLGRNTAPAIALAALEVSRVHGPDAVMLVLAADHLIDDEAAFGQAVDAAAALAGLGKLVAFGITPQAPETGYGYIEADGNTVRRFIEKPSLEKAQEYLQAGNFLWNSGMFCFRADTILKEMEQHCPDILAATRQAYEQAYRMDAKGARQVEPAVEDFSLIPGESVDYAVMERSANVAVVPCDIGWSDIGSWRALGDLTPADADGNRVDGEAILHNARNCHVLSDERLVALVGVDNLAVIDTADALLIVDRDSTQDVKQVYTQLKAAQHEAHRLHRTVHRPWGTYTVLEEGPRFKIKRIVVQPGASLSLQMHHHRSEHWIVVSGMAQVTNGETSCFVRPNESTYIPAGNRHRVENPGVVDLVMIEVQSGDYLGEDDIVRFEDVYGRA